MLKRFLNNDLVVILVMLIYNLFILLDSYFFSKVSSNLLRVSALAGLTYLLINAFSFFLANGITREFINNKKECYKYFTSGLILSLVFYFLFLIFQGKIINFYLVIFNYSSNELNYYLSSMIKVSFFYFLNYLFLGVYRSLKKSIYSLINLLFNLAVAVILNFRYLGDYKAIGNVLMIKEFSIFLFNFLIYFGTFKGKIDFKLEKRIFIKIYQMGLPSLIRQFLLIVSSFSFSYLLAKFDACYLNVQGLVNKINVLLICIISSVSLNYQARGDFSLFRKYLVKEYLILISFLILLVCFKNYLGELFLVDLNIFTRLLFLSLLSTLFSPFIIMVNMRFQGRGDYKSSLFLSIIRSGAIYVPLLFILESFYSLQGVLICRFISELIIFLINIMYLKFTNYKKEQLRY